MNFRPETPAESKSHFRKLHSDPFSFTARLILLGALAFAGPARSQDPQWSPNGSGDGLEVALVTVGPGQMYWERFGHNAIAIRDRATGATALYNYGIFDFYQESFLLNFVRGRMMYTIAVAPWESEIDAYRRRGRSVDAQWLNLSPDARAELRDFLEWNVRPEHAAYRYDYFVDNCSTRVRDALDRAAGGAIERSLDGRSRGYTFRMHSRRLTAPDLWLYLGVHAGLSAYADRPISFWEEGFVPMELQRRLPEVRVRNAQGMQVPLVAREERIAAPRYRPPDEAPPAWGWAFLACGLALAGALLLLGARRAHRVARLALAALAASFWLAMGLGGLALAGLWALTAHRSAWANENLLLFDPLCLLLVPAALMLASRRDPVVPRFAQRLAIAIAALAAIGLFLKVLPGFRQDNLDWIVLLLPVHLALAYVLTRARL